MQVLLDTHAFLWSVSDDTALTPELRAALVDLDNKIYVSAATIWELAIKAKCGKIQLPGPVETWAPAAIESAGFDTIDITPAHAAKAGQLPLHHANPFDRMLIAQAACEGLILATRDIAISRYDVPLIRA